MSGQSIRMPFIDPLEESALHKSSKMKQNAVYSSFQAKRNSLKIESYFNSLKAKRTHIFAVAIVSVISVVLMVLIGIYIHDNIRDRIVMESVIGLTSNYNTIYQNISRLLFEPYNIVNFLTLWPYFYDVEQSEFPNDAFRLAQETVVAFIQFGTKASTYIKYYYRGKHSLGAQRYTNNSVRLIYHTAADAHDFRSFYWETDQNGDNSSFPLQDGEEYYYDNNQHVQWISASLNSSYSQWTDIFFASYTYGPQPAVAVMKGGYDQENNQSVSVMSCILLETIQSRLLRAISGLTNNSRLAVTTTGGTIIGVTGEDTPMDNYNDKVVSKELSQLHDPAWNCVANDPRLQSGQNFSKTCTINNTQKTMFLVQAPFARFDNDWRLYGLFCVDDIFGDLENDSILHYGISALCIFGIIIAVEAANFAIKSGATSFQAKVIRKDTAHRKRWTQHISTAPLLTAVNEIEKLFKTHTDNKTIVSLASEVSLSLTAPVSSAYYDIGGVLEGMKPHLKKKFEQRFGLARPFEERHASMTLNHAVFAIGRRSAAEDISSVLTPEEVARIIAHRNYKTLGLEDTDAAILELFRKLNKMERIFVDDGLTECVSKLLERIPQEFHWLVLDSISFFYIMYDLKFKFDIVRHEISICVPLCTVLFHVVMGQRKSSEVMARFLLMDYDGILEELNSLLQVLPFADIEEGIIERVKSTFELIIASATSDWILPVITRLEMFLKDHDLFEIFNSVQSIEMGRFLYHVSTLSYFVNDQATEDRAVNQLAPEFSGFYAAGKGAVACIKREIIAPVGNIILKYTGKMFMVKFSDK